MARLVLVLAPLVAASCGRVAFDDTAPGDGGPSRDGVDASLACPPGYTNAAPGCYRPVWFGPGVTWAAAEADCEADGPGTHLVVIDDADEVGRIAPLVDGSINDFWIGVTDLVEEGTYRSVTNMPLAYTSWDPSEPDGLTIDNCLRLDMSSNLHDTDCANGDDYLCEFDGIAAVPEAYGEGGD